MKYLMIGLVILSLLIGLCWYSEREIAERTREIAGQLELALAAVRVEDDTSAQRYAARASAAWKENETFLASIISHDHTNAIAESLSQLPWLQGQELGKTLSALLTQIRGLSEMEQIVWKNLL